MNQGRKFCAFMCCVVVLCASKINCRAESWTAKASFPGLMRSYAYSFSIGNKAYVCGGRTTSTPTTVLNDLWQYDQATDSWSQLADFAGTARVFGIAFTLGNKGYLGMGMLQGNYLNDWWSYDPVLNAWTAQASMPGSGRYLPSGFAVSGKGYVGLGNIPGGGYSLDWFEYDPIADSWTQKLAFPGAIRVNSSSFVIGNKAYLGLGYQIGLPNTGLLDFWEYNAANDSWAQIASFPSTSRIQTAAFAIMGKGYIGTGNQLVPLVMLNDLWSYDPVLNTWIQKLSFGGTARDETAFCAIGNKGYIGLGWQNGVNGFSDWWEYAPDEASATIELNKTNFKMFPNPLKDYLCVEVDSKEWINYKIHITDINQKLIFNKNVCSSKEIINTSSWPSGVYQVHIQKDGQSFSEKIIKQ